LKNKWIIPVFIPHYGCPHQCIFCNQYQITGQGETVTPEYVHRVIEQWLSHLDPSATQIEVAFYGGSFTALPLKTQQLLLAPASRALWSGQITALRVSTRPDCITAPILDLLKTNGVSTVELGVQSLDDQVLTSAGRGHTAADVLSAVDLLKEQGFAVGIQLMPGLPSESALSLAATTVNTIALAPQFVRIYPVIVLEGTQLAQLYKDHRYQPLSVAQAVEQAAFMHVLFEKHHIPIIRTGLQATSDLDKATVVLAGPYHPAFGEMVTAYVYKQSVDAWLENVKPVGNVKLHCSPQNVSKVRGQKNNNMLAWSASFPRADFTIVPDLLGQCNLVVEYKSTKYVVKKINDFSC
jgi:histone acetyltransferase (RNA polymerase elongator complex component)